MSDSSARSTAPSASKTSATKRRIDGVRPCLKCGHDLHGQTIERSEALGLFFARCAECGTAAPLVEQPILGLWGRRVGIFFLMASVQAVLTIGLVTVLILFGTSLGILEEALAPARAAASSMLPIGTWNIDPIWWLENEDEVIKAMTTASKIPWTSNSLRTMALIVGPVMVFMGIIWSGLLLGIRRRHLPWVAVIANGLAFVMLMIFIFLLCPLPEINGPRSTIWEATLRIMSPAMAVPVCFAQMLTMTAGLLAGRPLLRRTACFILPPRSRTLLRALWDADGLKLPAHRG